MTSHACNQAFTNFIRLLSPGCWINDRIIHFCFRYFEHTQPILPDSILLLDPTVVSFLCVCCTTSEEIEDFARSGAMKNVDTLEYVFFPCSDRMDFGSPSTHWSIVVYQVSTSKVFHIDSHNNYNQPSAHRIAEIIRILFRYCNTYFSRCIHLYFLV